MFHQGESICSGKSRTSTDVANLAEGRQKGFKGGSMTSAELGKWPATATSLTFGDTLFTVCPWWDGRGQGRGGKRQLREGPPWADCKIGSGCIICSRRRISPTRLGRQALFRRRRTRAMDPGKHPAGPMVISGHVHQIAVFIPDGSRSDPGRRPTWVFNAGLPAGRAAGAYRCARYRQWRRVWAAARRRAITSILNRADAAGGGGDQPISPAWAYILGSESDPKQKPGETVIGGRLIMDAAGIIADHREDDRHGRHMMHDVGEIGGGDIERCASQTERSAAAKPRFAA